METKEQKIDFVILWVDGSDPECRKQKDEYARQYMVSKEKEHEDADERFRDWDQLKYLFRGIEKYAPWFNKIHFVTWGHLPSWLNTAHPKLHIVKHEEIIPNEFLPVFSSHAIELCINHIKGLSERLVYFNDDIFLLSPINETFFFKNGLPCCDGSMCDFPTYGSLGPFYSCINLQNMRLINRNFSCRTVTRNHWRKFFHPVYGFQKNKNTFLHFPWRRENYPYFDPNHTANPFLKSVMDEVWEKEEKTLLNTCSHRFRTYDDVNQYIFTYWQICKGLFIPTNISKTYQLTFAVTDLERICQIIQQPDKPILCINDDAKTYEAFQNAKERINHLFEERFPEKSSFEL